MLIHVVNSANRHLYADELAGFFKARHQIYVEEKGWRESDSTGLEIDQFDTDDATYLIGVIDGQVMTGTRLIPTDRPHLLSEVFPNMTTVPVRNPRVAEWTRGFIVPDYREKGIGPIKGRFCATVMEYCLKEAIEQIGGVQDLYWLPVWKRYGWSVRPIGNPMEIDGRWCVAALFDVNQEAYEQAARCGALTESILVHRGPYKPFVQTLRDFIPRRQVHAA